MEKRREELSGGTVSTYKAPRDATPTRLLLLNVSEMDRVADVTPENYVN
jgi:hypothetical protein